MKSKFLKRSAVAALSVAVLASSTPIAMIPAEAKTVSKINDKQVRSYGETADGLRYFVEDDEEESEEESVTIIGYYGSKTKIVIPEKIEGKPVRKINEYAFYENSYLEEIMLPNSLTEIGESAFEECISLENIMIPNSVMEIGDWAFTGCSNLKKIEVEQDNPVYDSRNNCNAIIETKRNELILGCAVTKIPNSVTKIGNSAFQGCISLENIMIPNSVTEIGSNAFWYCSSLEEITIPNSVTEIRSDAFGYCSSLEEITIPNSVMEIEDDAFSYCGNLKKIEVEQDNPVYDSRNNCNAIIETKRNALICGCAITKIPNSVTEIGSDAFSGRSSLEEIIIPNSVTEIGIGAFAGCISLENITIPNGVTEIRNLAFRSCSNLREITLPSSINGIGFYAFSGCDNLKDIYYDGTVERWKNIDIDYSEEGNSELYYVNIHYNSTASSCEINGHTGGKATCSQRAICSVCGQEYGELDPTNHKFTNYISDNNATTKADGTKTAYCDYGCGTKDTILDPGTKVPESETNQGTEKETESEKNQESEKPQESETNSNSQDKPQQKPEQTTLKKVAGVKVTSKAKGRVNVSWKQVTGAKGYQVQYSQKKNFAGAKTMKVSGGKKVKAIVKKLKSKKTYYFRVRAISGKTTGKWSAVKKVKKVK